jgi:hypothetical protein
MDRREFLVTGAAIPLALAFGRPALAAPAKGVPIVLVTADLESHVVALDLEHGRVITRIGTAPGPRAIEHVRGAFGSGVLVAHTEHGVVTLLGAESLSVRAEVDAFEEPRYACAAPVDRKAEGPAVAYVTDSTAEEVVTMEVTGQGRVLWRTRVPGPARHISISSDGGTIWTALGTAAPRIAELDVRDPTRPKFVRTFAAPFLAHDVVFGPDGRTAWVTSGEERRLALYRGDPRRARVLAAGAPPQHVIFTRDKALVASGEDGTVRSHRLDGSLVREARVPVGSHNLAAGSSRIVTPSLGQGTISILDWNGRVLAVRKVARAAHDACVVA